MEPATKTWKKIKTKEKNIRSEVSVNSPGNPWSQSGRRKGRAAVGRICRKGRFYAWSERVRGER